MRKSKTCTFTKMFGLRIRKCTRPRHHEGDHMDKEGKIK